MKRIVSLGLIAVLLLCTLCINALAAEPKEYGISQGSSVSVSDGGDYVIRQSYAGILSSISVEKGTLTIDEGVTVIVDGPLLVYSGAKVNVLGTLVINASEGKMLQIAVDGTVSVPGTVVINADKDGMGQINVGGTVNVLGTLDVASVGEIVGSYPVSVACCGTVRGLFSDDSFLTFAGHTYENDLCTVCGKKSIEGEPAEFRRVNTHHTIIDGGNYIISDCTLKNLELKRGTLTIPAGVTVKVESSFINYGEGTLNLIGTLDVSGCKSAANYGEFNAACVGQLKGTVEEYTGISFGAHMAACEFCGAGMTQEEVLAQFGYTASAISQGSMTLIVGIVCIAVGFVASMLIFKKNGLTQSED